MVINKIKLHSLYAHLINNICHIMSLKRVVNTLVINNANRMLTYQLHNTDSLNISFDTNICRRLLSGQYS
jgi:hypothetical protein